MLSDLISKLEVLSSGVDEAVKQATKRNLEEMIERGLLYSGIAMKGYAETGTAVLQTEIMEILGKIAELKPSISEWEKVRNFIKRFVELQCTRIHTEACRIWDPTKYPTEEVTRILVDRQKTVLTEVSIFIESHIKAVREEHSHKQKTIVWDIIKIVIGGIIGYILARLR